MLIDTLWLRRNLVFGMLFLLLATPFALAEEEKPAVLSGIMPNSPFYKLDLALERFQLGLTFNKLAKAQKNLEQAEERLAEINDLQEEKLDKADLEELTAFALSNRDEKLRNIEDINKGLSPEHRAFVLSKVSKHIDRLIALKDSAKEGTKTGLSTAIASSNKVVERLREEAKSGKN